MRAPRCCEPWGAQQGSVPPLPPCWVPVADFKLPGRVVASPTEWRRLRREVLNDCVVDGCRVPATDVHHLIPRSLRGSDVRENLIGLCHDHHMIYEDRGHGWKAVAASVRRSLTPEQEEYLTSVKSQEWLSRYYPEETR